MFNISFGLPDVYDYWISLNNKIENNLANKEELNFYNKLSKTIILLSNNPKHPGLNTHEIKVLSKLYGIKIWQSYIDNRKPKAGRVFWVYGPSKKQITIVGIEGHPDNKNNSYKRININF